MVNSSGLDLLSIDPQRSPYQGYVYGYPHKTAYRRFAEPLSLRQLWHREDRRSLFLYVHVPFCEMRCGFCNLFTQAKPNADLPSRYLHTLRREAEVVRVALGEVGFARIALGGGTPTFLTVAELADLFDILDDVMGATPARLPTSVETSPTTAEREKLALLQEKGVERISIGVQSFLESENHASARPQKNQDVEAALTRIRDIGFAVLNIDLIYGLPGQSAATWQQSLRRALVYRPEELYLYPLYVRPLTALGETRRCWNDARLSMYRQAREVLLDEGYEQVSMRMFRRLCVNNDGPVYCCQTDGMVGLGCGARSYTREVHYSGEYAVGMKGVREIIADYVARPAGTFRLATYGFHLNSEEQQRRFVLQSLLQTEGLATPDYSRRFATDVFDDFPELLELIHQELAWRDEEHMWLTETGLECSDVIGPWFYSNHVRTLMESNSLQ